ncbi:MAG TPA: FecR family protein [Nitrospirota bacterium]|nr:FecR family protein [Nitrospirota bacterium]
MTKRFSWLIVALLLCMGWSPAAEAEQAGLATKAQVAFLEGTARVFSREHPKGTALKRGDALAKGQEVRLGEHSRIELRFPDGTVMRFAEHAVIKVDDIAYRKQDGEKTVKIGLNLGKLWAKVKQLTTPGSRVEVWTANAVAGVRGTVYRVNAEEDKSAIVKVYDGTVSVDGIPREKGMQPSPSAPVPVPGPHVVPPPYHEVTMEEWHVIVRSFQQVTITPEGKPSEPTDFNPQEEMDDWVRWNLERDKKVTF